MEKYFQEIREIKDAIKSIQLVQKEHLTSKEAAEYLHISMSTLYKHTSAGILPFYRPNGKLIIFKRTELDDWITKKSK